MGKLSNYYWYSGWCKKFSYFNRSYCGGGGVLMKKKTKDILKKFKRTSIYYRTEKRLTNLILLKEFFIQRLICVSDRTNTIHK